MTSARWTAPTGYLYRTAMNRYRSAYRRAVRGARRAFVNIERSDEFAVAEARDGGPPRVPTSCEGPTCEPRWVSSVDVDMEVIAGDGMVFTHSRDGLVAFASDCGTGSERCRPSWTAPDAYPVLVEDGLVAAETETAGSDEAGVAVFRERCRTDGGVCAPEWRSQLLPTSVENGVLYGVTGASFRYPWYGTQGLDLGDYGVAAIPLSCGAGGVTCAPAWTFRPTDVWVGRAPIVDGDRVYVDVETVSGADTAGPTYLYAFGLPERASIES